MQEQELVALIKAQDKRGLSILYDKYSAAIFGVIVRIIKDEGLAEEILQDVFIKVWQKIGTYDADRSRLYTWLHRVATNTTIDVCRLKGIQYHLNTIKVDDATTLENTSVVQPYVKDTGLRNIVNKLKEEYRIIIEALYFKGYSQSEAAQLLGIPIGTVKTRSRYAILELRKLIS